MAVKKRYTSLNIVFLQYLVSIGISLILALLIPYILFSIGTRMGWVTYANASEIQAKNAQKAIAETEIFDSEMVPSSCTYVYLDNNFYILETNMEKENLNNAILSAKGKDISASVDECYLTIKRDDGYCVLKYYIHSRYMSDWMEQNLPNPEKLLIILSVINCLIAYFIVTTLFAKRMKKQLLPLMNATQKIKDQDLDFEIQPSKIKEFNNILLSISDMKSELKKSLEQQWKMEQTKREQTSALAHDIKTPLTIIKGNVELLNDSNQTDEQKEYTNYILKNTAQMEQYLKMLISLTKAESGYNVELQEIDTNEFINDLEMQSKGFVSFKNLNITFEKENIPNKFIADYNLLHRAIMNVISNAIDYSPENGKININIKESDNNINFCITDSGKGFSNVDIKQATNQFYMGDKSRNLKAHYGIGLYITNTIVKFHNGTLKLSNSPVTGGGQVTINIPLELSV